MKANDHSEKTDVSLMTEEKQTPTRGGDQCETDDATSKSDCFDEMMD